MEEKRKEEEELYAEDGVLKGNYANSMIIVHNREEFVIDFVLHIPPKNMVVSRIFTSPYHMKRILAAIEENLGRYEKSYGKIKHIPTDKNTKLQ